MTTPEGIPQLSDTYKIRREIGRGGMATVYLADDLKHDRQVAIKVLLPELSRAIGADRFAKEIRTVARLQHPHILPLFDSGNADGALYFVMPFVDGESLRDRLDREGALSLQQTASIIRQIGDALDYAHEHGVVHRDIKPENILLAGGQALLTDFGVARAQTNDELRTLTTVGMLLGTPAYMSPEQASGESNLDGRSDLYALGCVAFELLSGKPPFRGANTMATLAQHITRTPPVLEAVHCNVTAAVHGAIVRMLAKNPNERFNRASEFSHILESTASAAGVSIEAVIAPATIAKPQHSVCVLDFNNLALASDIDWLCGGVAETVSADLRKIAGVRVVGLDAPARQRAAAARSAGMIAEEAAINLGRSAGARWVVWGAFQKSGTRIRFTPKFSEIDTGVTHSVDKIDGDVSDIFALQDRIVSQLAGLLRIELTTLETAQIAKPETAHLSAYELYANGKRAVLQFSKEGIRAASEYFRGAIDIDPSYALAWAGLGSLLMPRYIATGDPAALNEGVEALQQALRLDPTLGEPYTFLSYMYMHQRKYDEAIASARMAIERDPGAHMPWYLLGISLHSILSHTGDINNLVGAVQVMLRARAINPAFHPAALVLGHIYATRGDYRFAAPLFDEAVVVEHRATGLIFLGASVARARVHAHLNERSEALRLLDYAIDTYSKHDNVYAPTMTVWAYAVRGRMAEAISDWESAERDYTGAVEWAVAHERCMGIGSHWIHATAGLSRLAWQRGDHARATQLLDSAVDMFERKHRFFWYPIIGCTPAESLYEIASTYARLNEPTKALMALDRAAGLGWADANELNADRSFDGLRDSAQLRDVLSRAQARITLAPPIGSGGLPDFAEPHGHAPNLPVV